MTATQQRQRRVATPWGAASVVDEIELEQRASGRGFGCLVQLLEGPGGRLVRFAYTTDGVARRGPVTLAEPDLERLRAALAAHPELAGALGWRGGGAAAAARRKRT